MEVRFKIKNSNARCKKDSHEAEEDPLDMLSLLLNLCSLQLLICCSPSPCSLEYFLASLDELFMSSTSTIVFTVFYLLWNLSS
jgi:hypothetical protein